MAAQIHCLKNLQAAAYVNIRLPRRYLSVLSDVGKTVAKFSNPAWLLPRKEGKKKKSQMFFFSIDVPSPFHSVPSAVITRLDSDTSKTC